MFDSFREVMWYWLVAWLVVPWAYSVARVVGMGWYKSKEEYDKSNKREGGKG